MFSREHFHVKVIIAIPGVFRDMRSNANMGGKQNQCLNPKVPDINVSFGPICAAASGQGQTLT